MAAAECGPDRAKLKVMRSKPFFLLVLVPLAATLLAAQGTYPYPYPRARRTTGIPTTGGHKDVAGTFHGTLKQLSNKEIVIQNEEDQTVVIRRSKKTKFLMDDKEIKASAIAMNTMVTVEAAEDVDLKPIAVDVSIDTPKKDSSDKDSSDKK